MRLFIIKIFLIILSCLFLDFPAFAGNFYIRNYDININVNKYKQAVITEDIDIYFNSSSHGINREIPYENAYISNIYVEDDKYEISKDGKNVHIKVGDKDKYISGDKSYKIRYEYNYADNKNEFYHNIIGNSWQVPIEHVTFKITLPDKVNPKDVGLSIGEYGVKGFEGGAEYTVNDNIITGKTYRTLNPREGVTIRVMVPDGYFDPIGMQKKINSSILLIIMLVSTFSAIFIWYKHGKEDKIVTVISFEPPSNVHNALEAEVFFKETATSSGIAALMIELVSKGYIEIEEKNNDFTLKKIKNFEAGEDEYNLEQKFLNALFQNGDIVTKNELKTSESFYEECGYINSLAESRILAQSNEKSSINFGKKIKILLSIFCIILCLTLDGRYMVYSDIIEALKASGIIFMIIVLFFCRVLPLLSIVSFFGLTAIVLCNFLNIFNLQSEDLLQDFAINIYNMGNMLVYCIICLAISIICLQNLPKKTKLFNSTVGALRGLKKYIKTAEKHQIEQMAIHNPEYFYKILPYAYVLGVSDVWISKFKEFVDFKPNTMETIKTVGIYSMPSYENGGISPSSSSGGSTFSRSSGGGGFSGGGGGGGGGSSW